MYLNTPTTLLPALAQILFLLHKIWKIIMRPFPVCPKSSMKNPNNLWSNGLWKHSSASETDNYKAQLSSV